MAVPVLIYKVRCHTLTQSSKPRRAVRSHPDEVSRSNRIPIFHQSEAAGGPSRLATLGFRRRVDRSSENDVSWSATRKSLFLMSKSEMLTRKSLLLTSKSELLTRKSLFLIADYEVAPYFQCVVSDVWNRPNDVRTCTSVQATGDRKGEEICDENILRPWNSTGRSRPRAAQQSIPAAKPQAKAKEGSLLGLSSRTLWTDLKIDDQRHFEF